jgi:hypothetical protein
MSAQASCPACGGPVRFTVATGMVTICEYCRSAVARGDRALEDLGKVADLVPTGAILRQWLKGRYEGVPFTLTGRAQLQHPAGGVWDEWYAAFADGRWGWLAEAQGRYYLTFRQEEPVAVPACEELDLGTTIDVGGEVPLVVAEVSRGRAVSAEGEIPYRLEPGGEYDYADLSGPHAELGTIDYGEEPPAVYVGRQVTLDDLGVPAQIKAQAQAREVSGIHLSCPNCGGALELRAPDRTERVGCPSCGSLLDVSQGNLRLLKALDKPEVEPLLPLGSKGTLNGQEWTVLGFLQRSVTVEGTKYYWEEYLLYDPRQGFRWLVQSDGHWSYVEPLPPGQARKEAGQAIYEGQTFKRFQRATARVEHVLGEFYWKVEAGERVWATDFVRPPQMLSCEESRGETGQEVNWSLGTYLPRAEVIKAFGVKELPWPRNVAPHQPFAWWGIYPVWGLLTAAALVLGILILGMGERRKVFEQTFTLQNPGPGEPARVFFTEPLELKARQNIRVTARANVNNSWVYLDGDFINEDTEPGLVQTFSIPIEYYHGVEGGESWSEGGPEQSVYVSALPAGKYTMRLEFQWDKMAQGTTSTATVLVEQGVPRWLYLVLVVVALAVVPVGIGIYHITFESRRWQESSIVDAPEEDEEVEQFLAAEQARREIMEARPAEREILDAEPVERKKRPPKARRRKE